MRGAWSFCFVLLATIVFAQPPSESEKLTGWYNNIDDALIAAQKENKHILIYFSGSDWCKPCIQLKEKVINSRPWERFSEEKLVLVKADFPRMKKNQPSDVQKSRNESLAEKYNNQGVFPLMVILSPSGQLKSKMSYHEESPEAFISLIKDNIVLEF